MSLKCKIPIIPFLPSREDMYKTYYIKLYNEDNRRKTIIMGPSKTLMDNIMKAWITESEMHIVKKNV